MLEGHHNGNVETSTKRLQELLHKNSLNEQIETHIETHGKLLQQIKTCRLSWGSRHDGAFVEAKETEAQKT